MQYARLEIFQSVCKPEDVRFSLLRFQPKQ